MTYQVRHRGPLLGEYWHRFLVRRALELGGVALLILAIALGVALGSYSIEDPGWFTATSAQVTNLAGPLGAQVSSNLITTLGYASWLFVAYLVAWGLRLANHQSPTRIIMRLWYVPIMLLLACICVSTLDKPAQWQHHFGLGGIVGDTALASIFYSLPGSRDLILTIIQYSGLSLLPLIAMLAFGTTLSEVRNVAVWLLRLPLMIVLMFMPGRRVKRKASQPGLRLDAHGYLEVDASNKTAITDPGQTISPATEKKKSWKRSILQGGRKLVVGIFTRNKSNAETTTASRRSANTRISIRKKKPQEEEMFPEDFDQNISVTSGSDENDGDKPPVVMIGKSTTGRPSTKAIKESQYELPLDTRKKEYSDYSGPPLDLLYNPDHVFTITQSVNALEQNARMLESVLEDYGVRGEIKTVRPGPVVTLYQLSPAPGLKTSRVMSLSDDIARSMSALSARISTVPGESFIGIELPNATRETVYFKDLAARGEFGDSRKRLPIALGKNIGGDPVIVDLASMPHLLIAGTTGSGKSVAINTMILSLLYSLSPERCRLILIDPKMLELSVYEGIPHLMAPVVTDPKKAVAALKWVVVEMEERYRKMSRLGVRNIDGFNIRMKEAKNSGKPITREHQIGFDVETGGPIYETESIEVETLPYIVVVVDEMADLMMVAGKEIEACVQRLAQMARASGIHIILATQRPSVDVITGVIKANFPTRISFQVSQKVDSRTILGEQGAEQLLGMGDMLYLASGGRIERVHGPFVSDIEVEQVVEYLRSLGPPNYHSEILDGLEGETEDEVNQVLGLGNRNSSGDEEYEDAVGIIMRDQKVSVSYLQRKMEIGYNKAARIVERMEDEGIVSAANHVGKREILVSI